METNRRAFRKPESYEFERVARDAVAPFLRDCGVEVLSDERRKAGEGESQRIAAVLPDGSRINMRVRLCWRRDESDERHSKYSAAQLRAKTLDGNWSATLQDIVSRNRKQGITHLLLFQRNRQTEVYAALVPIEEVEGIWWRQHEVSEALVRDGKSGRRRKNHAANGNSPTIWLQDDRGHRAEQVANVLWSWPGVIDLMKLRRVDAGVMRDDDTFDDCPGIDTAIGSDGAPRVSVTRSAVRRDPRVRENVRVRARGICERCGQSREYEGFLDVHHVMGADKSDRLWTCVALCPNCHREAHVSPEAEVIRAQLIAYAAQFRLGKVDE